MVSSLGVEVQEVFLVSGLGFDSGTYCRVKTGRQAPERRRGPAHYQEPLSFCPSRLGDELPAPPQDRQPWLRQAFDYLHGPIQESARVQASSAITS
jgi:hypothetical protein